jgi:L-fuconolactonase
MTVDSHQHFWNYDSLRHAWINEEMKIIRRDFSPDDLAPVLKSNKIEGCVAVQADQTEKETTFLVGLARKNSFIKGIVGWTDLRSPGVQARLEYYHQYDEIKGFRHIVQAEPNDFLLDPDFTRGIAALAQYNFTYDILVYPRHLPATITFIEMFPGQSFVIDHLAKPLIKSQITQPWKELIIRIARHENVYCKLSGMVTEADFTNWKTLDFRPYLDTVLEAFGPGRIMFGSDWPVCLVAASYEQQLAIIRNFIDPLSPSEKRAIMGENAARFYHLSH